MNGTANFSGLGLELPSPSYLIAALLFSLIGWVAYRRGRKTESRDLTWCGIALMVYPYFVSQPWSLWSLGLALCAWCYLKWE